MPVRLKIKKKKKAGYGKKDETKESEVALLYICQPARQENEKKKKKKKKRKYTFIASGLTCSEYMYICTIHINYKGGQNFLLTHNDRLVTTKKKKGLTDDAQSCVVRNS